MAYVHNRILKISQLDASNPFENLLFWHTQHASYLCKSSPEPCNLKTDCIYYHRYSFSRSNTLSEDLTLNDRHNRENFIFLAKPLYLLVCLFEIVFKVAKRHMKHDPKERMLMHKS